MRGWLFVLCLTLRLIHMFVTWFFPISSRFFYARLLLTFFPRIPTPTDEYTEKKNNWDEEQLRKQRKHLWKKIWRRTIEEKQFLGRQLTTRKIRFWTFLPCAAAIVTAAAATLGSSSCYRSTSSSSLRRRWVRRASDWKRFRIPSASWFWTKTEESSRAEENWKARRGSLVRERER